jgi:hypothetical protein
VVEAARRLHDEHLNVGSYHLFRLPEESEQDLHALALQGDQEGHAGVALQNKDACLQVLQTVARGKGRQSVGPMAIGTVKDLLAADVWARVAGTYLAAFEGQTKTYPYFSS